MTNTTQLSPTQFLLGECYCPFCPELKNKPKRTRKKRTKIEQNGHRIGQIGQYTTKRANWTKRTYNCS